MEKDLNYIIQTLLGCGFSDVEFLATQLNDFNVDFYDVYERRKSFTDNPTFNEIIMCLYEDVCTKHDIDLDRTSIFTNFLDSHLSIDGEECYNEADVMAKIQSESETE